MSIFYCAECDNLRDADDGCDESDDGLGLICIDCMEARDDDAAPAVALAEGQAPRQVEGKVPGLTQDPSRRDQ